MGGRIVQGPGEGQLVNPLPAHRGDPVRGGLHPVRGRPRGQHDPRPRPQPARPAPRTLHQPGLLQPAQHRRSTRRSAAQQPRQRHRRPTGPGVHPPPAQPDPAPAVGLQHQQQRRQPVGGRAPARPAGQRPARRHPAVPVHPARREQRLHQTVQHRQLPPRQVQRVPPGRQRADPELQRLARLLVVRQGLRRHLAARAQLPQHRLHPAFGQAEPSAQLALADHHRPARLRVLAPALLRHPRQQHDRRQPHRVRRLRQTRQREQRPHRGPQPQSHPRPQHQRLQRRTLLPRRHRSGIQLLELVGTPTNGRKYTRQGLRGDPDTNTRSCDLHHLSSGLRAIHRSRQQGRRSGRTQGRRGKADGPQGNAGSGRPRAARDTGGRRTPGRLERAGQLLQNDNASSVHAERQRSGPPRRDGCV